MGLKDLQLYKKERGGRWEQVVLPESELPPVDLGPRSQATSSPAPGRPCQLRSDKRSRESTGSPTGVVKKAARKENVNEGNDDDEEATITAKDWNKTVEEANLVTNSPTISPVREGQGLDKQPDIGSVMSISGTPRKVIQPPVSSMNSPIFTKQNKK